MGIKIDSSYNSVKIKYVNAKEERILFKGYTIRRERYKGEADLKEIKISEGIKGIGVSAFENCSSLTTVTLPSSLKRIEWNSFAGCSALHEIVLPASLDEVDCWFDGRGVAKLTLSNPSSDELIKELREGYAMDFYYKGEPRGDHWD